MGDVKFIYHERHKRRENEASQEIQKKECGNEENSAGSNAKRFWNGA
jgi:hypothetical protein